MDNLTDLPVVGSYPDPRVIRLSGIERMDLLNEGKSPRPPTSYWCGIMPSDWSPGQASFFLPPAPWFQMIAGLPSPGIVALPADAALGTAFATTLPAGTLATTSELTINYLRPVGMRSLDARATLIDATPYQGLMESSVTDDQGRMIAHLTSRYVTLRAPVDLQELVGEIPPAVEPDRTECPYLQPLPDDENPVGDDTISGLESILLVARGERPRPPITRLLGCSLPVASEGRFEVGVPASRWFTSPAATIYGGVTALLLELASTSAASTTLPVGWSCAPLDTKVQFLRPWFADGSRASLVGEVIHRGRSLVITRAELRNGSNKIVAMATGSTLVLQRPWSEFSTYDVLTATDED